MTTMRLTEPGPAFLDACAEAPASVKERLCCRSIPESTDNTPVFAHLMLDEAFSKSEPQFAQQALQAFRKCGSQLVIVATVQNATTIQPYIDSVVMVSKTEATGRNARSSRRCGCAGACTSS